MKLDMKLKASSILALSFLTMNVYASVLLSAPGLDSLAVDETSFEGVTGVEMKRLTMVRPPVLSPEQRQLLRYSVYVMAVQDGWAPVYGFQESYTGRASSPDVFMTSIERQIQDRLGVASLVPQTLVYEWTKKNGSKELLSIEIKKEKEIKTQVFVGSTKKRTVLFETKTKLSEKRADYQKHILNQLIQTLLTLTDGKELSNKSGIIFETRIDRVTPISYRLNNEDQALFAFEQSGGDHVKLSVNPDLPFNLVSLKTDVSELWLKRVVTQNRELEAETTSIDCFSQMKFELLKPDMKEKLEFVRKDIEKAILTGSSGDISFAISNLLDVLEQLPIEWELMPSEFLDEQTLVSSFTQIVGRAHQFGLTQEILSFIETQFNTLNPNSILNSDHYEVQAAPHPVMSKKLPYATVYAGWINGAMKLWIETAKEER